MKKKALAYLVLIATFPGVILADPGQIRRFPVRDEPWDLAVGDLNQDGHLDCVVANANDTTVTVLLGDGHANFADSTAYKTGGFLPKVVALGDFNNDGRIDIAVANSGEEKAAEAPLLPGESLQADQIAFLFQDSTGAFVHAYSKPVGDYPAGMVVGNFNEDSALDIAIADYRSSDVTILRGRGNGTFVTDHVYEIAGQPRGIELIDFNEDSHQDLAVALRTSSKLALFEGDGAGNFTVVDTLYELYQFPRELIVSDFNYDGHQDIVGACRGNSRIGIYFGTGTHVFDGPVYYDCGLYPRYLDAADIDEDGRVDIVTSNYESNDLTFFMGYGDGTFRRWMEQPIGFAPRQIEEGDFDEDGHPDLAVVIAGQDQLAVLLGAPAFITPVLLGPADGDSAEVDPIFTWSAVPGAKYFEIVVADSAGTFHWSKVVHDDTSTVYDGSAAMLAERPHTRYDWQVRQNTGGFFWNYSAPSSFLRMRRGGQAGTPVPKVPNAVSVALPELFSWEGAEGARKYAVAVYPDAASSLRLWAGYTESEHILVPAITDSLPPDSMPTWIVIAFDSSGNPGRPSTRTPFRLVASAPVPAAPLPLSPVEPDTVRESPVALFWSWPQGATHFSLVLSSDETFPAHPLKTWTFEDITDSSITVDLSPAVTDFHWYVRASNRAGESDPSLTARFAYNVIDSSTVTSVTITRPLEGMAYPFDGVLNALALVTGRSNATVTGEWKLDGESLAIFTTEMSDSAGVVVTSPPIEIREAGEHTIEVKIVSPDTLESIPVNFTISPETAGPPDTLLVAVNPQTLSADGVSSATIEAFVADASGSVVYSDSGRLISFVEFGEVEFEGSSFAHTTQGKASVTLRTTTVPDSTIFVLALAEGLKTGAAILKSYEGDYRADLSPLLAHMDRLSDLALDVYAPPYDLRIDSYDRSGVDGFLQERIYVMGEPAEEDKSGMRRLLYLEKALYHGYHHEYDPFFPDPRVEPGQGSLRMGDNVALALWNSSLLALEGVRTCSHILPKTKSSPSLEALVREKARKEGLSVLRDISGALLENAGVSPTRSALLRALAGTLDYTMTVLDSTEEPLSLIDNPARTSALTRDLLETIIASSHANLDTAVAWALRHNYGGEDSVAAFAIEQILDVIDAFTATDHEGARQSLSAAAVELPLEDMMNARYLLEKNLLSWADYQVFRSCFESSFLPERWENIRTSTLIASEALLDAGYGFMGLALEEAFAVDGLAAGDRPAATRTEISEERRQHTAPPGGEADAAVALWQGILERMASRTIRYEEKAREVMETLAAEDTLPLSGLLAELIQIDDSLSTDLDMALAPGGAVLLHGTTSVPGFSEGYRALKELHALARFDRLMFVLGAYEYALPPHVGLSASRGIDRGSKAIDSVKDMRDGATRFVTSLFTAKAYPLILVSGVSGPDTLRTTTPSNFSFTLTNLGAGTARDVWVRLFATSGVAIMLEDSVWIGELGEGESALAEFRLKVQRREIPEVERISVLTAAPSCANGLAYPHLVSVDLLDLGPGWDIGPNQELPADSVVVIRITRPVGGEILAGGSELDITWNTYGTGIDHLAILFSRDGGMSYPDTVTRFTENDGSYMWTLPVISTDSARVQLIGFSEEDVELSRSRSPGNFTVDSTPPTVDVFFPDGGDTLYVGLQYEVRWATVDSFPPLAGAGRRRSGDISLGRRIISEARPRALGISAVRRARAGDDLRRPASASPEGAGDLARRHGPIAEGAGQPGRTQRDVASARRGPRLLPALGEPLTVNLYYSTDSGQSWRIIALGDPDDGSYIWTVPNRPSPSCRVAVQAFDVVGNAGIAMSDSDFVIASARALVSHGSGDAASQRKVLGKNSPGQAGLSADESPARQAIPIAFELAQNTPNPFNPVTSIGFSVPGTADTFVSLVVYDTRGRKIVTLQEGLRPPGRHSVTWDGKDAHGIPAGSGLYIYELRMGEEVLRRKMTLVR